MQINNVTPTPPKTLSELVPGDCFVLARSPNKVHVLYAMPLEGAPNSYGIIEFGSNGVVFYNQSPVNLFSPQEVVVPVEIHSIDFSEKK